MSELVETIVAAISSYLELTGAELTHRSLLGPSDHDLKIGLAEHIEDAVSARKEALDQ